MYTVDKYGIYLHSYHDNKYCDIGSKEQCEVFDGPKEDIKVPH